MSNYLSSLCLKLIQTYKAHNQGLRIVAAKKNLASAMEEEQLDDILAIIQLLHHMTSKDFLDFSDGKKNKQTNFFVCVCVFLGDFNSKQISADVYSAQVKINEEESSVANVVFFGFENIIPLINLDLLNVSSLALTINRRIFNP